MYNIYRVCNHKISVLNLWKVDDKTYRVLNPGELQLYLFGSDYTLIDESLIGAFEHLLKEELEIERVKIFRKSTQEEWHNYYELKIKEHIDPEKIKITDPSERSVWQYNHHLFVSEDFKNELKKLSKDKLVFVPGFGQFG